MEILLGILVGLGLSAACGFRVFVPAFIAAIAIRAGAVSTASGFEWLGSDVALIALGVGTVLEVAAYYIPWVDNLLDMVALPAAGIAGTLLSASMMGDVSPWLQWSLAAIAGGGTATTIQAGTMKLRAMSSTLTGGVGNGVISTGEAVASTSMSALSIFAPVVAALVAVCLVVIAIRIMILFWKKIRARRRASATV